MASFLLAGCSSLGHTGNCPTSTKFRNGSGTLFLGAPSYCSVKLLTLSPSQHISYVIVSVFFG
jgi:hypothetical protein